MRNFYQVLINTLVANVTTSYLWFALTFWVYLETKSVLATGIIGGSYMLLVALCSIWFGTVVDRHKKRSVMIFASAFTLALFLAAAAFYALLSDATLLQLNQPWFWLFTAIILIGAVVENMRNIALSTIVTLLVKKEKRANANGLVGTVQGLGFIVTSVFSGLSIGLLGMGWTLAIACVLTAAVFVHMLFVKIPEKGVAHDPELENKKVDIKGSIAAITVVPGLFGLLFFSMLNNFIGGSYMALMDPYGLTLFSVEMWGILFGVAGTGFVIGGLLIAKFGLGKKPIKTLLLAAVVMGLLGAFFTIREWWWLYAIGIWLYMVLIPVIESAEQTVIQRVVPYERQGRVFGFAQALESSAAPITAFIVAPIAEFIVIPYMNSDAGKMQYGWLLGEGEARGIAFIFLISGLLLVVAALLAFTTKTYRQISAFYTKS
ncbi:MAG: Multidrug resistance protein [Candidatus Saccharibacteria bacterium GW2011_GWC2_48_9]|nr:MAG: Multidrug resistance protein [Candidatus Saccharibacteria bacterium GW2011_GWC2_48_9]